MKCKEFGRIALENLYNLNTQKQILAHTCGFDGIMRNNYIGGELVRRTEVEVRVGKLKNKKAAGKDEMSG